MLTEGKILLAFTGASTHVRRWSIKFGLAYAKTLGKTHPRVDVRRHLDEVFVSINGKSM
jgi:transposase-like protein